MRTETEALGRAALEDCLGSVGGELEREVLCSCNALFFEGGFVSLVRHDDCERHRLRGAAELNDDVDQRLGRFWIRAITDGSSSPLRFVLCSMGDSPRSTVRHALQGKGEHEGSPAPCNRRGKKLSPGSIPARASAGRNSG